MRTVRRLAFLCVCLASTPLAGAGQAADSRSEDAARNLAALLDSRKLDAVAAPDPERPGRFIAALYYPGSQLLVLAADYPAPVYLEQRLANQQYRDAYVELQTAAAREGRLFVTDLNADGLHVVPAAGEPFDITYADAVTQTIYNGDWRSQKLNERDYEKRFEAQDESYARMLTILAGALKPAVPTSASVR